MEAPRLHRSATDRRLQFSLAAEPADHVDFPATSATATSVRAEHQGRCSTADTLGKGRSSEQGTAEEQRCSEGFEPGHID
jgi:hypothetical protein